MKYTLRSLAFLLLSCTLLSRSHASPTIWDPSEEFLKAKNSVAIGDFKNAEPKLLKFANSKNTMESAAAKALLAEIQSAVGNYPKAQEWLLGARADDPENLDYRLALGRAYVKTKYFQLAVPEFEAFLLNDPTRTKIRFELAESYYNAKDLKQARTNLEKVLVDDPDFSEAYFMLANIYMILGQSDRNSESSKSYFAEAFKLYSKVREIHPDQNPVLVAKNIALCLYSLNSHEEAIGELENAIQAGAKDPELHFYKGRSLMLLKRYDEAIAAFESYRRARENAEPPTPWEKKDSELFWRLAQSRKALGDSTLSSSIADDYRQALKLDPENERIAAEAAQAFYASGLDTEAAALFETLALAHPDDSRILYNAGLPHLRAGNEAKALDFLKRAVETDTTSEASFRYKASRLATPLLTKAKRFDEARSMYRWLMEVEPKVCEHRHWYGYTFFDQKRYGESLPPLQAALQCYESRNEKSKCEYNELRWWVAYALFETQKSDDAYRLCKEVIKCDPKHADARNLMNTIDENTIETN